MAGGLASEPRGSVQHDREPTYNPEIRIQDGVPPPHPPNPLRPNSSAILLRPTSELVNFILGNCVGHVAQRGIPCEK